MKKLEKRVFFRNNEFGQGVYCPGFDFTVYWMVNLEGILLFKTEVKSS